MAQSPGVYSTENEVGSVTPDGGVGSSATVGRFTWGPCFQVMSISDPADLLDTVKAPSRDTAYSFLSTETVCRRSNDVKVVRVVDDASALNAVPTYGVLLPTVNEGGTGYEVDDVVEVTVSGSVAVTGKVVEVGEDGAVVKVELPATTKSVEDSAVTIISSAGEGANVTVERLEEGILILNDALIENVLSDSTLRSIHNQLDIPGVFARYPGTYGNNLVVDVITFNDYEEGDMTVKDRITGDDHVVSFDDLKEKPTKEGQFGVIVRENNVVVFSDTISTVEGDRNLFGQTIFIDDLAAQGRLGPIAAGNFGWGEGSTGRYILNGGSDGEVNAGMYTDGWDLLEDDSQVPAQVMFTGPVNDEDVTIVAAVTKHARQLAEDRGNTILTIGTPVKLIVGLPAKDAVDVEIAYRTGIDAQNQQVSDNIAGNAKRGTFAHNAKWTYDRFNDRYFWMDVSADKAANIVQVLSDGIPWQSAAGKTYGLLTNVSKLAYNPNKGQRGRLYKAGINPVVLNEGIFYIRGDKTMWTEPSAFSRENVVQIFNKMKVDISRAADELEFQNNSESLRRQYKNENDAYMRTIQARGGIEDFRNIVEQLNTPEVRARNEFRARHAVKPLYSINFVHLEFTAVGPSVDFEELEG